MVDEQDGENLEYTLDWAWAMSERRILSLPDHGQFVVVKGNEAGIEAQRPIFDPKIVTISVDVFLVAGKSLR